MDARRTSLLMCRVAMEEMWKSGRSWHRAVLGSGAMDAVLGMDSMEAMRKSGRPSWHRAALGSNIMDAVLSEIRSLDMSRRGALALMGKMGDGGSCLGP
jgi:hypothetical protein